VNPDWKLPALAGGLEQGLEQLLLQVRDVLLTAQQPPVLEQPPFDHTEPSTPLSSPDPLTRAAPHHPRARSSGLSRSQQVLEDD
jgi:hypothetical protein